MFQRNRRGVRIPVVVAPVLLLSAVTIFAGGPPIVTVRNMPEYFVVGEPVTLRFAMRARWNGEPLDGHTYGVRATAAGLPEIESAAKGVGIDGEYTATLTLPTPGEWTISIVISQSRGVGWLTTPLLPVKAILPGSPPPEPLSLVARGERFFVEKGCVSCHVNREVPEPKLPAHWIHQWVPEGPPNLTGKTFPNDYLRKILANGSAPMPNLKLTKDDIDALVAYINRDRPVIVSALAK